MAERDSEILDTRLPEAHSSSGNSSAQRWRIRAERVLGILRDRQQQYGDAAEVYTKLAALWSARLGVEIDAGMVMIMLMDMKTVRSGHQDQSQDTLDDIVGYAMLYGDMQ